VLSEAEYGGWRVVFDEANAAMQHRQALKVHNPASVRACVCVLGICACVFVVALFVRARACVCVCVCVCVCGPVTSLLLLLLCVWCRSKRTSSWRRT
jgi:hypothetical protein